MASAAEAEAPEFKCKRKSWFGPLSHTDCMESTVSQVYNPSRLSLWHTPALDTLGYIATITVLRPLRRLLLPLQSPSPGLGYQPARLLLYLARLPATPSRLSVSLHLLSSCLGHAPNFILSAGYRNRMIQLNRIYLVGVLIPSMLNDPSLAKGVPASHTVDVRLSGLNPFSIRRHFCIITDYDPVTRIGVMFLGTSRPRRAHRFVPCKRTTRLPHQPLHEVRLSSPGGISHSGYFNFTHVLRATIITQQTPRQTANPPQAFLSDTYAGGDHMDVFLNDPEMAAVKVLHTRYWEGVRYEEDGLPIERAGASAGGGPGAGLGVGWETGWGGGSGSLDGEGDGKGDRPINPDGSLHEYAINRNGTVTLAEAPSGKGGSGAECLARALKEEDERMERLEQLDLLGLKVLELDPPTAVAFVEPLIIQAWKFVDSF